MNKKCEKKKNTYSDVLYITSSFNPTALLELQKTAPHRLYNAHHGPFTAATYPCSIILLIQLTTPSRDAILRRHPQAPKQSLPLNDVESGTDTDTASRAT
jgi:hypothetical protein